jgi:ribosomal protein L15E
MKRFSEFLSESETERPSFAQSYEAKRKGLVQSQKDGIVTTRAKLKQQQIEKDEVEDDKRTENLKLELIKKEKSRKKIADRVKREHGIDLEDYEDD